MWTKKRKMEKIIWEKMIRSIKILIVNEMSMRINTLYSFAFGSSHPTTTLSNEKSDDFGSVVWTFSFVDLCDDDDFLSDDDDFLSIDVEEEECFNDEVELECFNDDDECFLSIEEEEGFLSRFEDDDFLSLNLMRLKIQLVLSEWNKWGKVG